MKKTKPKKIKRSSRECGLCGKLGKLAQTECCGQWICDDEDEYILFSYARNSCRRNHRRFTLCGFHEAEAHKGDWKTCVPCRTSFEAEMYVYYGTNEYNFEKLENPPSYEPTHCSRCDEIINLGEDGYSALGRKYFCMDCSEDPTEIKSSQPKPGRNDPCPCGGGKKYKKCCLGRVEAPIELLTRQASKDEAQGS